MNINDLKARFNKYDLFIKEAIDDVINSGWIVMGPSVKKFEHSFAEYLGAKYCIGLANGTDAIELALRAFGVVRGDKVATVANAGMYTTTALLAIGAEPYFLDVDMNSRNTTLAEVMKAVNQGVKAVVVTHLYGLALKEISQIARFCSDNGVFLLEDCAQAHGARVEGKYVGTFGDAASFSFYPTKNLGALGDGGAVITNNSIFAERINHLRQYGWSSKYHVEFKGARNSRLDEMQAAVLQVFLPDLDQSNINRRKIAEKYNNGIINSNIVLPKWHDEEYVAHLYVIQVSERESLVNHLRDLDIGTDIHYPIPDYRQNIFNRRFDNLYLVNTERLSEEVLTLPCYPEMTEIQVEKVIEAINSWKQ